MSSATLDEVWALFREVAETQKETARRFEETDRKFQETARRFEETDRKFQETDRKFQETDRKFQETDRKFQETDRKFQETARQIEATDRQIKQMSKKIGDLGNRLGEFVEGLVKPAVVRLFQARGIAVHEVHPDVSVDRHHEGIQIDLLVVNSTEAVLVEVKSKLTQADVDEHLERLAKFKRMLPRYADVRALGAVAAMVVPPEVARHAYRSGLYVLAQNGDSVVILNDNRFQPRMW
ncbi:MAG: DUF3782 domain-containing protein [Candidatus Contendobacter sp.]|nr:DUF3782 domain-containing protein [Candidatus Contendobacter sp.]